jgi:hypothetical protein
MELLKEVQEKLRDGSLKMNPVECAHLRSQLSGEYSFLMAMLEDILMKKPHEWNSMRPNFKSDTACEQNWKGTPLGLEEEGLRMRVKRCERLMSGLSSLIKLHESESRNLH